METYHGYIESVHDALLIFEACRLGYLSRVQRRLADKERRNIRSGSVFIWEEGESGIRRWTDGYIWSPSRVFGSFLTYRELKTRHKGKIPSPTLSNSDSDSDDRARTNQHDDAIKENGLVKQSMSVTTTTGRKLHLISYYNKDHVASGLLKVPSFDSSLAHIKIPKGFYPDIAPDLFQCAQRFFNHAGKHKPSRPPMIKLAPLVFNNSAQTPPLALPLQDIRLDRLPCSEDHRQLRVLANTFSL
ncbi:hypothetical protein K493DRAFT_385762 [Basidiobolus meristosporus CBS 931.73]|uniref:Gti1/Pac2 family-domain-containing protein n=1 Tax=Basidiobolus meristosporus CBS 931.73 TaxID=1314790 RepID=A0A1Y1XPR0_9FUNG|nr:hypothetical protein K493DRAFT_385762 [Basidiobolus meristosporus CBS 931.73]|eukprot:ORX87733.1 hypothetical protein K493DRAFT_385762 [Basidiobolus meristosporus CBS 931.73]